MSLDKLVALCKGAIDWPRYFELIGKKEVGKTICNCAPPAVAVSGLLLADTPEDELEAYLRFHAVSAYAAYLPERFHQASFAFYGKHLSGQQEQRPRWKRALGWVQGALGEAVGELYVARHFKPEAKERALKLVESVRGALEERLRNLKWMTEATRDRALEKMGKFGFKIGYPDEWIDYSTMEIGAVFACEAFHFKRSMNFANAPTDKSRWYMNPQDVNAYYNSNNNEIVFPAAMMQPPFFDPEADDAMNYGAIGAIMGHEMTHGFDDQGKKYDKNGNLKDWWTEEDTTEFERRVEVQVSQAGKVEVYEKKLDGKLTCGENIADLGGLRLAYAALQKKIESEGRPPPRNGFTAEQRFFLSWGTVWRENGTKEYSLLNLATDVHGPNEYRVNGPITNMPEFHEAFGVKEGDKMFLKESDRVDIW